MVGQAEGPALTRIPSLSKQARPQFGEYRLGHAVDEGAPVEELSDGLLPDHVTETRLGLYKPDPPFADERHPFAAPWGLVPGPFAHW